MTSLKVPWNGEVEVDASIAWGARAIFRQGRGAGWDSRTPETADIDLLHDRQGAVGDLSGEGKALGEFLDAEALPWLREKVKTENVQHESGTIFEFDSGSFHLKATPGQSFGYLYIMAWKEEEVAANAKEVK